MKTMKDYHDLYLKCDNSLKSLVYLKSYDPKPESKHMIYLDANNLYGYVMSKFLPTSIFKSLRGLIIDPKEFDLNKYNSNSSKVRALS